MIYPGNHHQDKNPTANNPEFFPRSVVQGHAGSERNEATEMKTTFLFSITASGVCCLFLLLQKVSPSGSMAFLMFSSPCNLPPSPIPHHKNLYSVYKKVKTNMYATYFIYPTHSMGTEIPPLNPAHSYVDLVIFYL